MNKIEQAYERIVEQWGHDYKGNATIDFGNKVSYLPVILGVLYKIFERDPTNKPVIIITDSLKTSNQIKYYITHTDIPQNNENFTKLLDSRQIRVFTVDYAASWRTQTWYYLGIFVGVNEYSFMDRWLVQCKFKLVCLTAITSSSNLYYNRAPEFKSDELNSLKATTATPPVEEWRIGVNITRSEDIELIKKYDTYIKESMSVFGDLSRIQTAINGDSTCNVSAISFCTILAKNNGWSEDLDMSIEYNKQIDKYFNPIAIQERAKLTYDIIRKRTSLIANNNSKLDTILKLCKDNEGKKILIISKTTEFAKEITAYLNAHLQHYCNGKRFFDACYNYHNDVEDAYDLDDEGNRLKVKSGKLKGTYRLIKGAAQMTNALRYYNNDWCNILSMGNTPVKLVDGIVDIIIITSPLCNTIDTYLYRLATTQFRGDKILIYKVFCKNTLETRSLEKEKPSVTHTIVNNCENDDDNIENNCDFVVI